MEEEKRHKQQIFLDRNNTEKQTQCIHEVSIPSQIRALENSIEKYNKYLCDTQNENLRLTTLLKQRESEIRLVSSENHILQHELQHLKEDNSRLKSKHGQASANTDDYDSTIKRLQHDIQEKEDTISKLNKRIHQQGMQIQTNRQDALILQQNIAEKVDEKQAFVFKNNALLKELTQLKECHLDLKNEHQDLQAEYELKLKKLTASHNEINKLKRRTIPF